MEEIKVTRSGKRPYARFWGEFIFQGSTRARDSTRWHTVRIFKTEKGYIVGIAWIACHEDERDSYEVIKAENLKISAYKARNLSDSARHNDLIIHNSYVGLATFGQN